MAARKSAPPAVPPIVAIFGADEQRKVDGLHATLDKLLPAGVDRGLALSEYDGSRSEDDGGPTVAAVFDDLATLPFLADRRVVLIRDADDFARLHKGRIENYLSRPSKAGTLVLVCRKSIKQLTRLMKAIPAAGGEILDCAAINPAAVPEYIKAEVQAAGKQISREAAARLADAIGTDRGMLEREVEKLVLYVEDPRAIELADVVALAGQTREEIVFSAMDALAAGDLPKAMRIWREIYEANPYAAPMALGGIAWNLRQWINAHLMKQQGASAWQIAPRIRMWNRAPEVEQFLRRIPLKRVKRALAELAELTAKSREGGPSIDTGVEALLIRLAG